MTVQLRHPTAAQRLRAERPGLRLFDMKTARIPGPLQRVVERSRYAAEKTKLEKNQK